MFAEQNADKNAGLDIHHNLIERMNDDCLEPSDGGVDQRWHHNFVRHGRVALRVKPIDRGPIYFYANQFQENGQDIRFFKQALKPGVGYLYNNSSSARQALFSISVSDQGVPNFHAFNNLFWTESWWGNQKSIDPNWRGDHNVFVRRGNNPEWETMRRLADKLGMDKNSRWIENAPSPFVDVSAGDFRLTPESPAIGGGATPEKALGIARELPGIEEFVRADGTVDAGALPAGAPRFVLPRDPKDVRAEPAGDWP